MSLIAITGAKSGIGAATAAMLRAGGHAVIGIDIGGTDITADLSQADGRVQAVAAVLDRCAGKLDGLVLCAGLGPTAKPHMSIVAVNYFGAVAMLDGLRGALERGSAPAAVVVSSVSSVQMTWEANPIGRALEAGDEARIAEVLAAAGERAGQMAYAGTKNALTVAVRRRAVEWGKAGVRLNTVAPGAVETPLLQAGLADPVYGKAIRDFVAPIGRRARPDEIASVIAFLLGQGASYVHGTQVYVDGGVDALARPAIF
ncbi:MAG: SDR family oxidoreductase [Steroidobacteraceae bacterium]|nr:3-alpha-hydroxysteroid dehydrogenase/carbonyl reductase [Steroidobacteraceae bacterium]